MRKVVIATTAVLATPAIPACKNCVHGDETVKTKKVCHRYEPTGNLDYQKKQYPSGCRKFYLYEGLKPRRKV